MLNLPTKISDWVICAPPAPGVDVLRLKVIAPWPVIRLLCNDHDAASQGSDRDMQPVQSVATLELPEGEPRFFYFDHLRHPPSDGYDGEKLISGLNVAALQAMQDAYENSLAAYYTLIDDFEVDRLEALFVLPLGTAIKWNLVGNEAYYRRFLELLRSREEREDAEHRRGAYTEYAKAIEDRVRASASRTWQLS